jgi:DNA topoisomerase-1
MLKAVKEYEKEIHRVGNCECGGELRIIHSKKTGKRFIGCSNYPKCTHSFPLPQFGFLTMTSKLCKTCGLKIVSVRAKGKRPWRLCVRCGFEKSKKKKAGAKKPAKPRTTKPKKG